MATRSLWCWWFCAAPPSFPKAAAWLNQYSISDMPLQTGAAQGVSLLLSGGRVSPEPFLPFCFKRQREAAQTSSCGFWMLSIERVLWLSENRCGKVNSFQVCPWLRLNVFHPFFFIVFLITFLNNLPEVTWAVCGDRMGCHMCVFGLVGVGVVSAVGSWAGVTAFTPFTAITWERSSIPSELSCPGALPNIPQGCASHTPLSG